MAELQKQLAELTSQLETLEMNMKKFVAGVQQMADMQTEKEKSNKEDEDAYRLKKQTIDLLPNAEENMAKLQVCVCVCVCVCVRACMKGDGNRFFYTLYISHVTLS